MLRKVHEAQQVQQLGILSRRGLLCARRAQAHERRVLAEGPARPGVTLSEYAGSVYSKVSCAAWAPSRATDGAVDRRSYSPDEASNKWHVEWAGRVVT